MTDSRDRGLTRADFPRALARFLDREDVTAVLRQAACDPFGLYDLRAALLDRAWALEPNDPADGSLLPPGAEPHL